MLPAVTHILYYHRHCFFLIRVIGEGEISCFDFCWRACIQAQVLAYLPHVQSCANIIKKSVKCMVKSMVWFRDSHVEVPWPLFSSRDQKMWQASKIKYWNTLNWTETEILCHLCNIHKMKQGNDRVKFYHLGVSHCTARGLISPVYHFRQSNFLLYLVCSYRIYLMAF